MCEYCSKGRETFFRASRYFAVVALMADSDAEVNIHVGSEDEAQVASKVISDAPAPRDVPLAGEAKEGSEKAHDAIVEVPHARTDGDVVEESFHKLSKIYKMIGGYDVEAQLQIRESERLHARKVLQHISKDKKNEKRRLNRIKERVSKVKNKRCLARTHAFSDAE